MISCSLWQKIDAGLMLCASVVITIGLVSSLLGPSLASEPQANPSQQDQAARIKRGEYLTNEVARCGDCHTPRKNNGQLDKSRWLQGAPTWITPKIKKGKWEDRAPDITSSGRAGKWSEAKLTKFLSTGERSDPPMPAYRLTPEDARAVAVYLRSLPGKKSE